MPHTMPQSSSARQSKAVDQTVARSSKAVDEAAAELSTDVDSALALLRNAVHEQGWTLDALEAFMHQDKSLISRVLNGERPLTLKFLCALPDDVERLYESKRAERFGLIVVAPLRGLDAQKAFVAGLVGIMSAPMELPTKASKPAKADLRPSADSRSEVA